MNADCWSVKVSTLQHPTAEMQYQIKMEFGMAQSNSYGANMNQAGQGANVDWYTPSTTTYRYSGGGGAGPSTSSMHHGGTNSFEDEPPLLEGTEMTDH